MQEYVCLSGERPDKISQYWTRPALRLFAKVNGKETNTCDIVKLYHLRIYDHL